MGTVITDHLLGVLADVVLDGDPFPTYIECSRIEYAGAYDLKHPLIIASTRARGTGTRSHRQNEGTGMPIKTRSKSSNKPNPKELRRECKRLGIKGWESMGADEMSDAIKQKSNGATEKGTSRVANAKKSAGKSSVKKSGTKKANEAVEKTVKAKKAEKAESGTKPAKNGNPFKEDTNLHAITELLIEGGKRSAMVKKLEKTIDLKPRGGGKFTKEENRTELDRRVLITAQLLERDHGFTKELDGRGPEAKIQVFPPKKKKANKE